MKRVDIAEFYQFIVSRQVFFPQPEGLEVPTCVSLTYLRNWESIGTWDVAFAFQFEMHERHHCDFPLFMFHYLTRTQF
jgi:hypothetical protein